MKYECAVFEYVALSEGFFAVFHREIGKDYNPENYVRVSEWVPVEFPMLPDDAVAEYRRAQVEAKRASLQAELERLNGVTT